MKSSSWVLSRGFNPCQNRNLLLGDFFCSFRKERRTQPVLVHQGRLSPETGFIPAFHCTLFCDLIRCLSPNQFCQKLVFRAQNEQARSTLSPYKSGEKNSYPEKPTKLSFVVCQSSWQPAFFLLLRPQGYQVIGSACAEQDRFLKPSLQISSPCASVSLPACASRSEVFLN